MERDYAQTKNGYGNNAAAVREASLRNKADETDGYINQAHNLLSALEDALHGASPRAVAQADPKGSPEHPGLRNVLCGTSERAAHLVSRLDSLLGSL